MKIITKAIQELLEAKAYLRDCDKKLSTHIWYKELSDRGVDVYGITAAEFLFQYAEGKLTSNATISRLRAMIQEKNPALRGKKYLDRQIRKQEKVKKDLGYHTNGNGMV